MSIVNPVGNHSRDRLGTSAITHGNASSAAFATVAIVMLCPTIDINCDVAMVLSIVFIVVIFLLPLIVAT